jgi:hypothetical protein
MPYTVKKVKGGYKACKKGDSKCFSKKPLTKKKAVKQIGAIASSEKRQKETQNESFDSTVNKLLSLYLFEDAMGSSAAIKPADPKNSATMALKQAKKKRTEELQKQLGKPPSEAEVDAFIAGQAFKK